MLIVFDDVKNFRDVYKQAFPRIGIEMEILECSTKLEIRTALNDPEIMQKTKVIVFDLSTSQEEAQSLNFDILNDIKKNYSNYCIPIFIHSAFAEEIDGYDNLGTLFKIKKGTNSIETIIDKIKLFYESGFLEIFSPGGLLESQLHKEIHQAFNNQFVGQEIESIIKSIIHSFPNPEDYKHRTKDVFERIAVRSLYQNLLAAKKADVSQKIEEIKINAVEHYYRRKSDFPIWTGDIFRNKKTRENVIIITPRCDINNGNNNDNYFVCKIDFLEKKKVKEFSVDVKAVHNYINDNPQNTGHKFRFLIPTPFFEGGKIDLTNYFILKKDELIGDESTYEYCISLSDELTNDVVRKFASYILRSGISQSDLNEASFYSLLESEKDAKAK